MTSEKIEYMIVRAIANLADKSPTQRQKVYEAAVRSMCNAMGSQPSHERDRRLDALKQSIIQIEMHYQSLSEYPTDQTSHLAEPSETDYNATNTGSADFRTAASTPGPGSSRVLEFFNPFGNWKVSTGVFSTVFLLCMIAGYTYFQFYEKNNSTDDNQASVTANNQPKQSNESRIQTPARAETDENLIFNAEADGFFELLKVQGKSDRYQTKTVGGEKVHWFSGRTKLISKNFFEVLTDRIYHMSVELRPGNQLPVNDLNINAGFATYNAERKIETEAPGRHRYFVSKGMIGNDAVQTQDGWFVISGIITGVAPKPDAFRKTSKFARPIIMMNIGATKTPLEIRSVKVVELL